MANGRGRERDLRGHYGWYNTRRIQKGLDDRSPDEYEAAWYATADQTSPAAELTNAH